MALNLSGMVTRYGFVWAISLIIFLCYGNINCSYGQEISTADASPLATASLPSGSLPSGSLPSGPGRVPFDSHKSVDSLPRPLDPVNADRYRDIFKLQKAGNFQAADRMVSSLTDLSLLGTVLGERYLSALYKPTRKELAEWLTNYAALPQAVKIYNRAQKLQGTEELPAPQRISLDHAAPGKSNGEEDQFDASEEWKEGLAAWQAGNFTKAAAIFSRLADSTANPPNKARYAYWAARAYLRGESPTKVSAYLRVAAKQPLTFYGQIARRALGVEEDVIWKQPRIDNDSIDRLLKTGAGKRGLSLIQIGEKAIAEKEFISLERESVGKMELALLALSRIARMPALEAQATMLDSGDDNSARALAALYPMPDYKLRHNIAIDRALVFAVIRIESRFNPSARNKSGALGLMQMLPSTARLLGYEPSALKDPRIAIEAGQKYIGELFGVKVVNRDLLLMLAAYNAGPGNLAKWKEKAAASDDALLFLETMPSAETRSFVRRAMAAYWIYQQRMSQETPTLTALSNGGWPRYLAQGALATAQQ